MATTMEENNMAGRPSDSSSSPYQMPMMTLRQLMELRTAEGMQKVTEMGGVNQICTELMTDPNEGI